MTRGSSVTARNRRLAEEFERGSESRCEFCRRHGLSVHTLDYHRRRLNPAKPRLVPLRIVPDKAGVLPSATLVLAGSRRIEFADPLSPAQISELIRAAESA